MNKKMFLVLMAFLGSSLMVHAAQQVIQLQQVVKSVSFSGQYSIGSTSYSLPEVVPAVTIAIANQLNNHQQLEFWIVNGNGWGGAGFDLMVAGQGFEQMIYHLSQRVFGQEYANYSGSMTVTYGDNSTQEIAMPTLSGMSVGNPVYVKGITPFQVQTIGQGYNLSLETQVVSGLKALGTITSAYFLDNQGNKYFFPITALREINLGLAQGINITTTNPYSFTVQGLQVEQFSTNITNFPLKLYLNNSLVAIIQGFYHQYSPTNQFLICILKQ